MSEILTATQENIVVLPQPEEQDQEYLKFDNKLESSRPALTELALELKEGLLSEKWDSIIGDEVSGHLPTLFIHELMKRVAHDHDAKVPVRILLAAGHNGYDEQKLAANTEQFLASRKDRLGERALIVTEYIMTGKSVKRIVEAMPESTEVDIAAVGLLGRMPRVGGFFRPTKIYHSESGNSFYGAHEYVGRKKVEHTPFTERDPDSDPELVRHARDRVVDLADSVYDQLFVEQEALAA